MTITTWTCHTLNDVYEQINFTNKKHITLFNKTNIYIYYFIGFNWILILHSRFIHKHSEQFENSNFKWFARIF